MEEPMNSQAPDGKPHTCYVLLKRPGEEDQWLKTGVALPLQDGKGFYLLLGSFPLMGGQRILLLPGNEMPDDTQLTASNLVEA
jgi:hypothetical protein